MTLIYPTGILIVTQTIMNSLLLLYLLGGISKLSPKFIFIICATV